MEHEWQPKRRAPNRGGIVLAHIAQPPLRILDVGCGAGLVAQQLQARLRGCRD